MKIKNKPITIILIANLLFSVYGTAAEDNIFGPDKHGQEKSCLMSMAMAQEYYDASLKGELRTAKKEAFYFSSLKLIESKSFGGDKEGVYEDTDGGIWLVKYYEEISVLVRSRVMDLLIGPFFSDVKTFIDAPGYIASKFRSGFLMREELLKDYHYQTVGEEKLLIAMDLVGLHDRSGQGLAYMDMGDSLEAFCIHFDDSFYKVLKPLRYKDLKFLESINALPADEKLLYVIADACNDLWEAGISIDYAQYKDLGSTLKKRKHELEINPEFRALYKKAIYNEAENNPDPFTKEDFDRLNSLVSTLFERPILHWAIYYNEEDLIGLFLDMEADINAEDKWGDTPLILAAEKNNLAIVTLLLDRGADVNAKNTHGRTALAMAEARNDKKLVELLNEKMTFQARLIGSYKMFVEYFLPDSQED